MAARAVDLGPDIIRQVEKSILLQTLDQHWREHLVTLEHLRKLSACVGWVNAIRWRSLSWKRLLYFPTC